MCENILVCVWNSGLISTKITVGKQYAFLERDGVMYNIIDDNNISRWVNYQFFISIIEYREKQINSCIDE